MAIQDNAVLWNRLEQSNPPSEPGYGPNGVDVGSPVYGPGKFNNGIINPDVSNYVNWANIQPQGQSIAEMWWNPTYGPTTAGFHSIYMTEKNFPQERIQILQRGGVYKLACTLAVGGVLKVRYQYNAAGLTWTPGTWNHLLFAFYGTGAAGRRFDLYLNTVLQTPTTILNDADYAWAVNQDVRFVDIYNFWSSGASFDNIKIYNSTADLVEILANRNNEGWPVVGGKRMIDGGIHSNMIDGSVLVA